MARFGGKKGIHGKAKGAEFYGLTEERFLRAWEWYQRGFRPGKLVHALNGYRVGMRKPKITFKKLIVEYSVNGVRRVRTVTEGQQLTLP